jgi:hypothetical protein
VAASAPLCGLYVRAPGGHGKAIEEPRPPSCCSLLSVSNVRKHPSGPDTDIYRPRRIRRVVSHTPTPTSSSTPGAPGRTDNAHATATLARARARTRLPTATSSPPARARGRPRPARPAPERSPSTRRASRGGSLASARPRLHRPGRAALCCDRTGPTATCGSVRARAVAGPGGLGAVASR